MVHSLGDFQLLDPKSLRLMTVLWTEKQYPQIGEMQCYCFAYFIFCRLSGEGYGTLITKLTKGIVPSLFKSVIYAENEGKYEEKEEALLNKATLQKYSLLLTNISKTILPRKKEWSLTLSTHNVNNTNYAEVSFRITKGNQFNRTKAYNCANLVDIILDDSLYYITLHRCMK